MPTTTSAMPSQSRSASATLVPNPSPSAAPSSSHTGAIVKLAPLPAKTATWPFPESRSGAATTASGIPSPVTSRPPAAAIPNPSPTIGLRYDQIAGYSTPPPKPMPVR
jgi:hypothetical protein